jgi:hypothetical protein
MYGVGDGHVESSSNQGKCCQTTSVKRDAQPPGFLEEATPMLTLEFHQESDEDNGLGEDQSEEGENK